ncbi:hypothetical protein RRG08_010830 [Elysia crispata]|uniref:Uncharacterized protein n=1 Tax=Elysia crispata TaxID=231223 RepID=A0AAE0XWY3_9GAST|nr:hypothetical protein RRG08_010830 [Elysia crispata]
MDIFSTQPSRRERQRNLGRMHSRKTELEKARGKPKSPSLALRQAIPKLSQSKNSAVSVGKGNSSSSFQSNWSIGTKHTKSSGFSTKIIAPIEEEKTVVPNENERFDREKPTSIV